MIAVYLNRPEFEYDIHSLIKAFFPREEVQMAYTFAEEDAEPKTHLALRRFVPSYVPFSDPAKENQKPDGAMGHLESEKSHKSKDPAEKKAPDSQIFEIFFSDQKIQIRWLYKGKVRTGTAPDKEGKGGENKNALKRALYWLMAEATQQSLPWGALTGIRPTKLSMKMLSEGKSPEEIIEWTKETYLTSEKKAALSVEIAKREREILDGIPYRDNYSLYVDIPFCPTRCLYCSFTAYPISAYRERVDEYLDALEREMQAMAEPFSGKVANSVYVGGGTPTTLSPDQLRRLISMIRFYFDLSDCREFTVEAGRPDSVTKEKLLALREGGVDRICINPQTMKQETLDLIGRRHSVQQTIEGFYLARSLGFANINMDLIMGLPGEDLLDARHSLSEVRRLHPDGLTVHSLAVKRAARLSAQWEMYRECAMVNTQEHMDLCEEVCRMMGLYPYYLYRQKGMAGNLENVGYAAKGKEGLYNILMMEEVQTILALGAGASTKFHLPGGSSDGTDLICRVENVKDIENYLTRTDEMIARKKDKMEELGWHKAAGR